MGKAVARMLVGIGIGATIIRIAVAAPQAISSQNISSRNSPDRYPISGSLASSIERASVRAATIHGPKFVYVPFAMIMGLRPIATGSAQNVES